jgi:hypothetical protein
MDAPKGTKVLTHEQQLFEMMQSKGIAMSSNYTKANGMTAQRNGRSFSKTLYKIQTNVTTFDQNGKKLERKQRKQNNRNNNRVQERLLSITYAILFKF